MNIGIITLSASYNCGSLLQCYALKNILKKYGDVEVINFTSVASKKQYDIIPHSLLSKLKKEFRHLGIVSALKKEKESYNAFQRDYLQLLGEEYFADDLIGIGDKYDVVVVGSDQVWNVCMSDFDEAFFCDWVKTQRVAYAPSLGGHDIRECEYKDRIISYIKQFDNISVREQMGKQCLEEVIGKKVKKVLDPTLLLNPSVWQGLTGARLVKQDYIFYYSWAYCNEDLFKIVQNRSRETGLPVYVIDAHKWCSHSCEKFGFTLCREAGPLAFLNLMANAKECYVESFHGMIFAYIFKKNFWLLDTHSKFEAIDARLMELINLMRADSRVLTKDNCDKVNLSENYIYMGNTQLENMKKESLAFLEGAINRG